MRLNDDGKTVAAADCLVPGIGEIIGGSQRGSGWMCWRTGSGSWAWTPRTTGGIWTCAVMAAASTRGFGLGFERMVMYLTGVGNIRDVLPPSRTVGSADF